MLGSKYFEISNRFQIKSILLIIKNIALFMFRQMNNGPFQAFNTLEASSTPLSLEKRIGQTMGHAGVAVSGNLKT